MPRKTTIPIYDGDDFERVADLRQEVVIAERKLDAEKDKASDADAPTRVGDAEPDAVRLAREALQAAQEAFNTFVDEASERAEMWVLHPIGHEEFRKLLKDHPARTVDSDGGPVTAPEDRGWDLNTDTFPKALVTFVDPEDESIRTVIEPNFESEAEFRRRIKRLSAGEFNSIWTAAYMLNSGGITDPKSLKYMPGAPRSSAI